MIEHIVLALSLIVNLAFALIMAGALAMRAELIPRDLPAAPPRRRG